MEFNTLLKRKNHTFWWQQAEVKDEIEKATTLYKKIGEQKSCDDITHFLMQFDALHFLLLAYNHATYKKQVDQYLCICSLLEKEFDAIKQKELLDTVNRIGIDTLNEAFNVINQDCENPMEETLDLFYFIKKHRLNKPENCSDEEIFKKLSFYLNVTLINYNRINNLRLKVNSEKLLSNKSEATKTVIPVVEKIFELILDGKRK